MENLAAAEDGHLKEVQRLTLQTPVFRKIIQEAQSLMKELRTKEPDEEKELQRVKRAQAVAHRVEQQKRWKAEVTLKTLLAQEQSFGSLAGADEAPPRHHDESSVLQ